MALTQIKTNAIADDAVTTDKLADAINTARDANTAKTTNATHSGDVTGSGALTIADDAVTLAKMAGGTDGQIITYDASGDPVAVGPGTDGQVLTSTGAGSPPAFEDVPAVDSTSVNAAGAVMNTDLSIKGKIVVGDGSGDPTLLAVGTDDHVLTADSSAASGVAWKAIPEAYNDNQLRQQIAMLAFYRATDHSKNEYTLTDQVVDHYNDDAGIDASASTNEQRHSDGYYYGGTTSYPTGGTITTHGSYRVHSFTTVGDTDFVVSTSGTVSALVVGGGGGGGSYGGGGGAAVKTNASMGVTAQTYTVTVADGGDGAENGSVERGVTGGTSSFNSLSAAGGGGGGGINNNSGLSGASGGGGAIGCNANGPCGTSSRGGGDGQGGAGGNSYEYVNEGYYSGGGGGGYSGTGGQNGSTTNGGNGGAGVNNDYRTGSNVAYGGGGGGAGKNTSGSGSSTQGIGAAGGGNGYGADGAASSAGDNTGSGGGADYTHAVGSSQAGHGGSGIVVIRYATTEFSASGGDLTLQSTAKTANAAPTKADLIILMENKHGTATVNTDVKGYISRDGSAFSSAVTFVDEGDWGATGKRVLAAHDVDISGITSGTSMKYKITTHNQSAGSKETYIHAASLGWR